MDIGVEAADGSAGKTGNPAIEGIASVLLLSIISVIGAGGFRE